MSEGSGAVQARDVARVVGAELGCRVASVARVIGSVTNTNFAVDTAAGPVVLKCGAASDMRAEAWACDRVRKVGVAAPEVLALDTSAAHLDLPYLLTRRLLGEPSEPDGPALVEAGRQLARVHGLPVDGYGFLRENAPDAPVDVGPRRAWAEVVTGALDGLPDLVAAGVLPAGTADRLRAVVHEHPSLARAGPAVLLHGDLHPRHVFCADGRLTGIIDWGDVAAGDPLFDLGRFSVAGPVALDALLRGYTADRGLDPGTAAGVTAYRVLWAVLALTYEFRAGGNWFAAYRDVAHAGLAELGR